MNQNIAEVRNGLARDGMSRRRLLATAALALSLPALAWRPAHAQSAPAAGMTAPIQDLHNALLTAMKSGRQTPFDQRASALKPVIQQVFDLNAVLAASVGLSWSTMPDDQRQRLLAAFQSYTVSSYTANFDSYSGQSFRVLPTTRDLPNGDVMVQTQYVPASGSPTNFNYVMRQTPAGWKVVDVLADGSISRVAVQRSDFRSLLARGGVDALLASLQNKVRTLSGDMNA
jgi:phospholipid transport system substrate-binding protein